MIDPKIEAVELFGYLGEDELGSGVVGLKQAEVPAGRIAIVAVDRAKVDRDAIAAQLQAQANVWGKTIYLCRFKFVEVLREIRPGWEKGQS